jgi:hypothetical protein
MSKLINDQIEVHQGRDSRLRAFIWRKRLYKILAIIGWWREPSSWWDGEQVRLFIRLTAQNYSSGNYELYKDNESWFLSRVLD